MRQRAVDFIAFLRWLRPKLPDRSLVLVLDEDPSHTAHASRREAQRLGIELLFLPKRSPELNPMQSLWRMGKNTVCANRQYQDLLDEIPALVRYLSSLTDEQALQIAGILSPSFWLRFARSKFLCGAT